MIPPCRRAGLLASLFLIVITRSDLVSQSAASGRPSNAFDREYTLETTMLGYRGVGGTIDGVRNPTLWARRGETVRISIVNGELMVHDLALERLGLKTTQILDKGATANITFKAGESDTYFCSIPGHRAAGMEGRLDVSDEARVVSEGIAPASAAGSLNLDFETGTLDNWAVSGDAFAIVKSETQGTR